MKGDSEAGCSKRPYKIYRGMGEIEKEEKSIGGLKGEKEKKRSVEEDLKI